MPLPALRSDYRDAASTEELEKLARKYRVSTLVVLKRVFDAGFLTWDDYRERYDDERERVIGILAAKRGETGGGNYYYTQPIRLSRQFAQAVVASTFEGSTTFRDAYRLLGTRKHSTFEQLAAELGWLDLLSQEQRLLISPGTMPTTCWSSMPGNTSTPW